MQDEQGNQYNLKGLMSAPISAKVSPKVLVSPPKKAVAITKPTVKPNVQPVAAKSPAGTPATTGKTAAPFDMQAYLNSLDAAAYNPQNAPTSQPQYAQIKSMNDLFGSDIFGADLGLPGLNEGGSIDDLLRIIRS
jgi:hypothetical protein